MALRKASWKEVKIGDVVFIDEYEDGKFPKANPRITGPFTVEVGNGCGHCLKNPRNGRGFMHYPDNLLVEIKKSPNPMYTDEEWDMMERLLKMKTEQPELFWATVDELRKIQAEEAKKDNRCGDCHCKVGEAHKPGCDIEQCAECGSQRIGCHCRTKKVILWQGEYHGKADCRRLGFYCKPISANPRDGWIACEKSDPNAREDLNRLVIACEWDKKAQRFELRKS
jgi:hypothetical protein